MEGVDINCTDKSDACPDNDPLSTALALESDGAHDWLTSHPSVAKAPAIRLLTLSDPTLKPNQAPHQFAQKTVEHAIWNPDVYFQLARNRAGACAALLDEPYRFVLQTPSDGGPFVSLALSRRGVVMKGVYVYNSAIFEPQAIMQGEQIMSGWRGTGLQIISLPQAVAKAHAGYISQQLDVLLEIVAGIEQTLVAEQPEVQESLGIATHSQQLQRCSVQLLDLERRARFQNQVFAAIESVCSVSRHGTVPWPPLAPLKSQLESWSSDFETLPLRIGNARGTIATQIQQRNETIALDMAATSRRMTELAMKDNATMKTIAILTMVFLPGTAVASVFSMGMFNWSAETGSGISTKWLWIFFAVAIPLTVIVLLVWWLGVRRYERQMTFQHNPLGNYPENLLDLDERPPQSSREEISSKDLEMQVRPGAKAECVA